MATAPTPIGDIGAYRPHVIKQGDTFGPFTLTIYAPPVAPATVATVVADLSVANFLTITLAQSAAQTFTPRAAKLSY